MADNIAITAGAGTNVAADDIGSVFYQRVKLSLGADGAAVDAVAGAGIVSTGVQRMTLASDDPAVASLGIIDDWDETDRAKVNIIAGQVAITAAAGAVAANTPRVTLGSDDPAVTALQIMDDWDETNRAAVNLIASQAGITAAAGAVAANTPRVTLGSDDPAVTALQIMDDWDSTDSCKVVTPISITTVTLSLDTNAYADGDVLAATQIVTNCFRIVNGFGVIDSITVLDEDDQGIGFDLVFFDANTALGTENSAPDISDANARTILGWVRVSAADFIDLGGSRLATLTGLSLAVKSVVDTDDMYVAAISRGAGTYSATGIQLRIGISQS
jgi:hypothetical protein